MLITSIFVLHNSDRFLWRRALYSPSRKSVYMSVVSKFNYYAVNINWLLSRISPLWFRRSLLKQVQLDANTCFYIVYRIQDNIEIRMCPKRINHS